MSKRKVEEVYGALTADTNTAFETWYGYEEAEFGCAYSNCLLCNSEEESFHSKNPTWSNILWIVFRCLQNHEPERSYFSLKDDVYPFIWLPAHWDKLCKEKENENDNKQRNVKKKIQDALSHNHKIFESGACKYKQNGYWRLREKGTPGPAEKKKVSEDAISEEERVAFLDASYAKFRKDTLDKIEEMREEVARLRVELQYVNSINPIVAFDRLRQETHTLIDHLREQIYSGVEAGLNQECFSPSQLLLFEQMEKTKDIIDSLQRVVNAHAISLLTVNKPL